MAFLKSFLFSTVMMSVTFQVSADDNFCRKCHVMREYHKKNPNKYEYYEDYLKDLKEKGPEAMAPSTEDLPDNVRHIMESSSQVDDVKKP